MWCFSTTLPRATRSRPSTRPLTGDRFSVVGREVYLSLANGAGRTKLTLDWLERGLGVAGTQRNWNTVLKLTDLTAARAAG